MSESKGLSIFNLKIIAIVTMFIDHIGAAVIEHIESYFPKYISLLDNVDMVLRSIGRLAFPLFIFMLIEGFKYTKSRGKYLFRLMLFAFISDVPFEMAIDNREFMDVFPYVITHANVFYTLALGLIGMITIERITNNYPVEAEIGSKAANMSPALRSVIRAVGIAGTTVMLMYIASWLDCDYEKYGVLAILVGYALRGDNKREMIGIVLALVISNPIEACAFFDVWFVAEYNGEKGRKFNKWFFYIFYPAHFLLLAFVREMILKTVL